MANRLVRGWLFLASIVVAAYLVVWLTGTAFSVLLIAAPAVFGCVLALALPGRERWLVAPVFLLALAYWISSWVGDAYDIGRTGLVLVTGLIGASFLLSWFVGVRTGRILRRHSASRPQSSR